jgi:hypothetical protein
MRAESATATTWAESLRYHHQASPLFHAMRRHGQTSSPVRRSKYSRRCRLRSATSGVSRPLSNGRFVDFDSLTVEADRQTISPEDRQQLVDLLKHRPLQFLSTLFGQKEMELMMLSAIKNTRAMAVSSDRDL